MIKKLMGFTLSFALLLTGCSQQLSPKDTLSAVTQKMAEQKTYSQSAEGVMSMIPKNEDDTNLQMLGMFENLEFNYTSSIVDAASDNPKMSIDGSFNANGLAINMKMYADTEEIIVDYPMLGKLVVVKIDELYDLIEQESGTTLEHDIHKRIIKDIQEVFQPIIIQQFLTNIKEEDIELIDEHAFMYNDTEVKSKALKLSLSKESYIALTKGIINALKDDEKVYNALKSYNIPDFPETFDAYKEDFNLEGKDFNTALDEVFAEMDESLNNMTYNIILGYDKDYLINYIDMDMQMTIPGTANDTTADIDMKYNITSKLKYKDVTADRPETTDDNSIGLQDLMMGGLGY